MSSSYGLATVKKVERYKGEKDSGFLVTYHYRDVDYLAQPTFYSDDEMSEVRINERQSRSWMPLEFVYATGKSLDWTRYPEDTSVQRKIANAFVKNFSDFQREGRGLYISSSTKGSGKTLLACSLANEILKNHDVSVKFINQTDYVELIKQKDDDSRQRIESVINAGLLIFDDVGTQIEDKGWITTALFRLIDKRYVGHLPTIFTSNVRMEELKTDDRIFNRIYAVSVPVVMPEISVRKEIADKHTKDFLKKILEDE